MFGMLFVFFKLPLFSLFLLGNTASTENYLHMTIHFEVLQFHICRPEGHPQPPDSFSSKYPLRSTLRHRIFLCRAYLACECHLPKDT
jgi:hypothetical protein